MKIHKIFETPLYLYTDKEFLKLNKVCDRYIKEGREWNKQKIKNRKKFYKKDIGDFGLSHASTTLLEEPKMEDFEKFVGQTAYNILDAQGFDMSKQRVDFTEMWVQEFGAKGGGHQRNHVHHAHLSGFYFLKCSEKTSYPIFHDPRPGAMMTKLPFKEKKETMTMTEADVRPKPGDFIFFNSYLPHEFTIDPGIEPFRFIHFNLIALPEKYFEHELSKK